MKAETVGIIIAVVLTLLVLDFIRNPNEFSTVINKRFGIPSLASGNVTLGPDGYCNQN